MSLALRICIAVYWRVNIMCYCWPTVSTDIQEGIRESQSWDWVKVRVLSSHAELNSTMSMQFMLHNTKAVYITLHYVNVIYIRFLRHNLLHYKFILGYITTIQFRVCKLNLCYFNVISIVLHYVSAIYIMSVLSWNHCILMDTVCFIINTFDTNRAIKVNYILLNELYGNITFKIIVRSYTYLKSCIVRNVNPNPKCESITIRSPKQHCTSTLKVT